MNIADVIFVLSALGWGLVCGAAVYEHVAMVPVWARLPPDSLSMWQGPHRVRPERLWKPIHPIVFLLIATTLGLHWDAPAVATRLMLVLASYLVILVITGAFFIPELMCLVLDASAPIDPATWRRRARRWERLSQIRGVVMLGLALVLYDALRLA